MGDFISFVPAPPAEPATPVTPPVTNPPVTTTPEIPEVPEEPVSEDERAIYLPPELAGDVRAVEEAMLFAKESKINTILVDIKNEEGNLLFDLPVSYPFQEFLYGDFKINPDTLLTAAKENDISVIGRICAFKDNIAPRKSQDCRSRPQICDLAGL